MSPELEVEKGEEEAVAKTVSFESMGFGGVSMNCIEGMRDSGVEGGSVVAACTSDKSSGESSSVSSSLIADGL